jgi:hypothetical protein
MSFLLWPKISDIKVMSGHQSKEAVKTAELIVFKIRVQSFCQLQKAVLTSSRSKKKIGR